MTDYLASLVETGLSIKVPALPSKPAAAGEQVLCRTVLQADPYVIHETYEHAAALADELGIPFPRIQWFSPVAELPYDITFREALARIKLKFEGDYGDFLSSAMPFDDCVLGGLADTDPGDGPPVILLLHTLRGDLLRMVVAHEMRHLAQDASMTRREREEDAERFGMAHVA